MVAPSIGVSPGDAASFQQTYFSIIENFLAVGNYLEDLALKQPQERIAQSDITITQGQKVLYGEENGKNIDYLFGPLSQQLFPDLPQKLNQIRQAEVGIVSTLPELRVELNNQTILQTDSNGVVKVNELKNLPFDKLPELFQRIAKTPERNQSTAIEESIIKALNSKDNQSMNSKEPSEDVGLQLPPDFDEASLFSDPQLSAQATELFGPPPEPTTPAQKVIASPQLGRVQPEKASDYSETDEGPMPINPPLRTNQTNSGLVESLQTDGGSVQVDPPQTNSAPVPAEMPSQTDVALTTPLREGAKLEEKGRVERVAKKARPQLGQNTNGVAPGQQLDIGIPISREETVSPLPTLPAPISREETLKNSTTTPAPISREETARTVQNPISREETVPTPQAPISREETTRTPPALNSPINILPPKVQSQNNDTSVGDVEPKGDRTGLGRVASISNGLEDMELKALLVEQIKATRELQQQFSLSSTQFQELVSSRLNSQNQTNWWEQLKESFKGLGEQFSTKLSGMAKAFHQQQTEHRAATSLHELFQSQVGKDGSSYLSEKYSIQREGNFYTLADSDGNSLLKWKSTPFGVSSKPGSNKLDSQQLDSIKQLQNNLLIGKISDEWTSAGSTETSQFKRTMSITTNLIGSAKNLGSSISLDGQAYKIEATASGCKVSAKDGRGNILNFQDGQYSSSMSSRDLAYFEKMMPVLTQQYAALGNQKSFKKHGMER